MKIIPQSTAGFDNPIKFNSHSQEEINPDESQIMNELTTLTETQIKLAD